MAGLGRFCRLEDFARNIKHFSFTSTPPQPTHAVLGRSKALESLLIQPLQANDGHQVL
jgi:hypothetical protein